MAGRIRTVKPEWLDDEKLASCSSDARVMSVALLLLADDHGRGRAHPAYLLSHIFPFGEASPGEVAAVLAELVSIGYVSTYNVRGQTYFEIRNWSKHQRVDKPGKPRVPAPGSGEREQPQKQEKAAYFIRGRVTGLIKIGESIDPVARLVALGRQTQEPLDLLAVGGSERDHHKNLARHRVHGEWFRPSDEVLGTIRELGGNLSEPVATIEYDGGKRVVTDSGTIREPFALDLRPPTSDPERDQSRVRATEQDPDHLKIEEELRRHPALACLDAEATAASIVGYRVATGLPLEWHLDAIRRVAAKVEGAELAGAPWAKGSIGSYLLQACSRPSKPRKQDDTETEGMTGPQALDRMFGSRKAARS